MKNLSRRDFLRVGGGSALALGAGCSSKDKTRIPPPPLRTLHLIGSNGSSAWFQLLWPHVEVAAANNHSPGGTYAYLEPASAGTLVPANPGGDHEWHASSQAPWMSGGVPIKGMEPSMFMAGRDETHTVTPGSAAVISGTADLPAGCALLQSERSTAPLPVTGVDPVFYGTAPGAPAISTVADADALVALYLGATGVDLSTTPADLADFGIDTVLASGLPAIQASGLYEFGRRMIVAAKAFALGLSDSILLAVSSGPTSDWLCPDCC